MGFRFVGLRIGDVHDLDDDDDDGDDDDDECPHDVNITSQTQKW